MKKPGRILIILMAVIAGLAVIAIIGHRSHTRSALARFKAELRANGEKLTYAELRHSAAPNANNSEAILVGAAAQIRNMRLQPGALELMKYVGPGQAQASWMQDQPGWGRLQAKEKPAGWDEFRSELTEVQPVLAAIREALKEPAPDGGPRFSILSGPRVDFVRIRIAGQWLTGATLCEVRQGHRDDALTNLEALTALARVNREEYTLVAQMIRVAIAGLGLSATWEVLQAQGWTEPQLVRLQKGWESVELVEALENGFLGERALGAEVWDTVRSSSARQIRTKLMPGSSRGLPPVAQTFDTVLGDYLLMPIYKLASIDEDELLHLQTMQNSLVAIRLLKAHQGKEARQQMDANLARINGVVSSSGRFRYVFSLLTIPNFSRAANTVVRNETLRQLMLAAIALKRFQLRYSKLPDKLDDLVPEFLSEVPYDPMGDRALGYYLKPNGSFVLYSVGEDGQDDTGDPTPKSGSHFGLWEGRDAVWPAVAPGR